MGVLADGERVNIWSQYMRNNTEPIAVTKPDLRAAVDAIDDFLVANAGALNSAIPQPARGALTTSQKAALLMAVVARRYLTGA